MSEETAVALTENVQQLQNEADTQPVAQPEPEATEQPAAEATEQPTGADDGQSEAETTDTEGEKHRRNNVPAKERIKQLTDQRRAAEARAAELERQLQAMQTEKAKDPLDYANDTEYQRALLKEAVAEARADFIREQAETANAEKQALRAAAWEERTASFKERAADFDQVVYSQNVPITPAMAEVIMDSDNGADVAYYLGKNPHEARRIAGLHPLAAAREIGRLEQRFAAPPAVKKVTSAPRPVTTLQGHGSPTDPDPARMTHEQYREWRRKNG